MGAKEPPPGVHQCNIHSAVLQPTGRCPDRRFVRVGGVTIGSTCYRAVELLFMHPIEFHVGTCPGRYFSSFTHPSSLNTQKSGIMTNIDLNGKVVVVTGAGGRLGRRLVPSFAACGARIAAVVRNEEEARGIPFPEGAEGWAFQCDVTDEDRVEACFSQIGARFGHVDVLVHTVGGWEARPLLETTRADWEGMVGGNLTSTFLCFREAARLMQGRGGRLIGIASAQGADRGRAREGAYSAAKAGVVRLVEAVAAEFSGTGITATAIAPSSIRYDEEGGEVAAEHVVETCLYLCLPAGEAFSGATLRVYGNGAG